MIEKTTVNYYRGYSRAECALGRTPLGYRAWLESLVPPTLWSVEIPELDRALLAAAQDRAALRAKTAPSGPSLANVHTPIQGAGRPSWLRTESASAIHSLRRLIAGLLLRLSRWIDPAGAACTGYRPAWRRMPTTGAPARGSDRCIPQGSSPQRRAWLSYGRPVPVAQPGKAGAL